LLVFLLVSGEQTFTENFAIPNERIEQIARKNDGASANSNTSTAAPPDRNSTMARGAPAKISDVTGRGLDLFVTPDKSRPGNAASKLWRMGYRFDTRQKTYSIGPYGNGKDGTFSLSDARRASGSPAAEVWSLAMLPALLLFCRIRLIENAKRGSQPTARPCTRFDRAARLWERTLGWRCRD
jgi:hypothetical protein